jgi:hypothetical protein
MAIVQLSKRPVHSFSNPCESFKWLSVVHEELGINRRNDSTRIFRIKETADVFITASALSRINSRATVWMLPVTRSALESEDDWTSYFRSGSRFR